MNMRFRAWLMHLLLWHELRPVRLARDWGLIDTDEYLRRCAEADRAGLPRECYERKGFQR